MYLIICLVIFGMDKKWITNNMATEMSITKKMLATLRQGRVEQARQASQAFVKENKEDDNFITRSRILMQEAVDDKKKVLTEEEKADDSHDKRFEINKNTPQFGDVRTSQEEAIKKTINDNIKFESDALIYYPSADDMTLDGEIPQLSLKFQFRYSDPSGDGVYAWMNGTQLTESNARTIGKLRDAYLNWKNSITSDADLMSKLKNAAENAD